MSHLFSMFKNQLHPKSLIQKKFWSSFWKNPTMCMLNIHMNTTSNVATLRTVTVWVRFPIESPVVMGNRSCQQTEVCPSTLALRGGGFCQYCKCPGLNMTRCMVYCRYNMYMFRYFFWERERESQSGYVQWYLHMSIQWIADICIDDTCIHAT